MYYMKSYLVFNTALKWCIIVVIVAFLRTNAVACDSFICVVYVFLFFLLLIAFHKCQKTVNVTFSISRMRCTLNTNYSCLSVCVCVQYKLKINNVRDERKNTRTCSIVAAVYFVLTIRTNHDGASAVCAMCLVARQRRRRGRSSTSTS